MNWHVKIAESYGKTLTQSMKPSLKTLLAKIVNYAISENELGSFGTEHKNCNQRESSG